MKIAIVLIDRTLPGIRELMDSVRNEFGAEVVRDMIDLGATRSFRAERNQHDAELLLKEMIRLGPVADKTLFIFRKDLFVGKMNFVFGIASGDYAIVSTTRLDPRFYGEVENVGEAGEQFKERLIKEALHELGHTFGLPHCKNKKCVMIFSNSIEDVDFKKNEFCEDCATVLSHLRKEYE